METIVMVGVREHGEGYPVELVMRDRRIVIRAYNEAHNNTTEVDLVDVLDWLRDNNPAYLTDSQALLCKLAY